MNLKVVSKTTKYRDFTVLSKCTVILQIFYCDFLTALVVTEKKQSYRCDRN